MKHTNVPFSPCHHMGLYHYSWLFRVSYYSHAHVIDRNITGKIETNFDCKFCCRGFRCSLDSRIELPELIGIRRLGVTKVVKWITIYEPRHENYNAINFVNGWNERAFGNWIIYKCLKFTAGNFSLYTIQIEVHYGC